MWVHYGVHIWTGQIGPTLLKSTKTVPTISSLSIAFRRLGCCGMPHAHKPFQQGPCMNLVTRLFHVSNHVTNKPPEVSCGLVEMTSLISLSLPDHYLAATWLTFQLTRIESLQPSLWSLPQSLCACVLWPVLKN